MSEQIEFLSVKHWAQFQHYRDRSPPWIKLHVGLLDDFQFFQLSERARWQLPLIWLMASKCDNKIPNDPMWFAYDLRVPVDELAIDELRACGFLVPYDENQQPEQWTSRYIPKDIKTMVWERDKGRCQDCGGRKHLEYDHIVPVSRGGDSTLRNIQLLCRSCNRKKRTRLPAAEQGAPHVRSLEERREEETGAAQPATHLRSMERKGNPSLMRDAVEDVKARLRGHA